MPAKTTTTMRVYATVADARKILRYYTKLGRGGRKSAADGCVDGYVDGVVVVANYYTFDRTFLVAATAVSFL